MKKFVTSIAALTLAASLLAGASAVLAADDTTNGDLPAGFNIPNSGEEMFTLPDGRQVNKAEYDKYVAEQKAKEAAANQNKPAEDGNTSTDDKGAISGDKGAISGEQKEDKKEEKKADKPATEKVLPKTSAVK